MYIPLSKIAAIIVIINFINDQATFGASLPDPSELIQLCLSWLIQLSTLLEKEIKGVGNIASSPKRTWEYMIPHLFFWMMWISFQLSVKEAFYNTKLYFFRSYPI